MGAWLMGRGRRGRVRRGRGKLGRDQLEAYSAGVSGMRGEVSSGRDGPERPVHFVQTVAKTIFVTTTLLTHVT